MIAVALDNYHVVVLGLTLFVVIAAYRLRQPNRLPDDIPWAGSFTTSLGKVLAPYKAVFRGREYMDEAYHKVGSKGVSRLGRSYSNAIA